jgi:hypothetical protein
MNLNFFARRYCKQQGTPRNCEIKIENCQQFTMVGQKNQKNYAQQIVNTKHKKTSMNLHNAYGVRKENESCKSEC